MPEQLKRELVALWERLRPRLRRAAVSLRVGVRWVWSLARPPLLFAVQVLAALIVLFEEWGWKPLSEALAWLARFRPWAAIELWIAGLPAYGALVVFALPTTLLLPLKFVAVWLLANGFFWSASALFIAAKLASTALIARIFTLTKPALMRIGWFARAYNIFTPWKEALFATIRASWAWRYGRMVKTHVRLEAKQAWARMKPRLESEWARWKPWLDKTWRALYLRARLWGAGLRQRMAIEARRVRIAVQRLWSRLGGGRA